MAKKPRKKQTDWSLTPLGNAAGDLLSRPSNGKQTPAAAANQITSRKRPDRSVTPDPDYVSDLEIADSQRTKRMAARDRGKRVKPPAPQ